MERIEKAIQESSCFGIAYDGTTKECTICEVKLRCENKTKECTLSYQELNEPKKKVMKSNKKYASDMPDFRVTPLEELERLTLERYGSLDEFEKYTDPKIKRMRLTMVLKKTYEVK